MLSADDCATRRREASARTVKIEFPGALGPGGGGWEDRFELACGPTTFRRRLDGNNLEAVCHRPHSRHLGR
jgi:hypothetical protein